MLLLINNKMANYSRILPMNAPKSPQTGTIAKQAPRTRKSVMISPGPHHQLEKMAKQFKVKNNEFVEAAIAYFHENGQSPFTAGSALLSEMESKIDQQALETRQHNTDTSNQLEAIMRDAERGLGKHLQEQQGGTMLYLQRIERTILTYLTQLEAKMLKTLLKQVLHMSAETNLNRLLLETLLVKHDDKTYPIDRKNLIKSAAENEKLLDTLVEINSIKVSDVTRLAPVFASEMPSVAAPSKPSLLSPKKVASGGGVAFKNPSSGPDSAG